MSSTAVPQHMRRLDDQDSRAALGTVSEMQVATDRADETELPAWMHAVHTTIIKPHTPSLDEIGLDARLIATLERMGARECFPVQATVVPAVLAAYAAEVPADVCVCAPTGSGKTLAYALPIVQALLTRIIIRVRALVLLPTRSLAAQVHRVFTGLCEGTSLRVALAAGQDGISWEQECISLRGDNFDPSHTSGCSSVDIIVATPGRLVEHLQSGRSVTLQHLRFLVIDEADRLLSQGYQGWLPLVLDATHQRSCNSGDDSAHSSSALSAQENGIGSMIGACDKFVTIDPITRRPRTGGIDVNRRGPSFDGLADAPVLKMLFSATLTRSPAKLAPLQLVRPRYFCVAGARYATPSTLREWMLVCSNEEKPKLLAVLLQRHMLGDDNGKCQATVTGHESEEDCESRGDIVVDGSSSQQELNESDKDDVDCDYDDRATDATRWPSTTTATKPSTLPTVPTSNGAAIVFTSSLEATHRLTRLLQLLGIECTEFSSAVPARERAKALEGLRSGKVRVLITSDAMARGMDVEDVSVVINYEPPANIKGYVHRVGRTARAGRTGTSYTLLRDAEVHHFKLTMAKAGKAWRPLELHSQAQAIDALDSAYRDALSNLQWVLAEEKAGRLQSAAPIEVLEEALGIHKASGERVVLSAAVDRAQLKEEEARDEINLAKTSPMFDLPGGVASATIIAAPTSTQHTARHARELWATRERFAAHIAKAHTNSIYDALGALSYGDSI